MLCPMFCKASALLLAGLCAAAAMADAPGEKQADAAPADSARQEVVARSTAVAGEIRLLAQDPSPAAQARLRRLERLERMLDRHQEQLRRADELDPDVRHPAPTTTTDGAHTTTSTTGAPTTAADTHATPAGTHPADETVVTHRGDHLTEDTPRPDGVAETTHPAEPTSDDTAHTTGTHRA